MIINYGETKELIGWIYQEESNKKLGLSYLIINTDSVIVAISALGISTDPDSSVRDPYGPHVIKRFYEGDTISFTVEEGDW